LRKAFAIFAVTKQTNNMEKKILTLTKEEVEYHIEYTIQRNIPIVFFQVRINNQDMGGFSVEPSYAGTTLQKGDLIFFSDIIAIEVASKIREIEQV
jgi:hypothetical protein